MLREEKGGGGNRKEEKNEKSPIDINIFVCFSTYTNSVAIHYYTSMLSMQLAGYL
jgi:hypothetical protein